jgi:large subunit ribosomal protein L36
MKVVNSIRTAKSRSKTTQVVRRKGRLFIIDKKNPRFKVRQG